MSIGGGIVGEVDVVFVGVGLIPKVPYNSVCVGSAIPVGTHMSGPNCIAVMSEAARLVCVAVVVGMIPPHGTPFGHPVGTVAPGATVATGNTALTCSENPRQNKKTKTIFKITYLVVVEST